MLNSVKAWVNLHNWQLDRQLTVLAVSGGMDSISLFYAFLDLNFPFVVAHVNFGLRSEESDGDEQFVRQLCEKHTIPCFIKQVPKSHWAKKNKNSIQMEARTIRYRFFEEILEQQQANFIATAHHEQDNLENFFIYLYRDQLNTAWKGISVQNGNIIRPLLSTSKRDIEQFLQVKNAIFRNDSSNYSIKYLRNKVRHGILPFLEDVEQFYADFRDINQRVSTIRETQKLKFDSKWLQHSKQSDTAKNFIISALVWEKSEINFIYQKMSIYGFSESQVEDAFFTMHQNGAFWKSELGFLLIYQSNNQLLCCREPEPFEPKLIHLNQLPVSVNWGDLEITISLQSDIQGNDLNETYQFAINSKEFSNFMLRSALPGDKMLIPGLNRHKKVSDILNENKIPGILKSLYPIIQFGDKILSVISIRQGQFSMQNADSYLRIDWKVSTQSD